MITRVWTAISKQLRISPGRGNRPKKPVPARRGWLSSRLRKANVAKKSATPVRVRISDRLARLIKNWSAARKPKLPSEARWRANRWLRLWRLRKKLIGWRYRLLAAALMVVVAVGIYAAYSHWAAARLRAESLAVVNGRAIGRGDIEAEARAQGIDPAVLDPAASRALVEQVVERRVLVDAAKAQGISDDPRVKPARERAEEMVIANVLMQRIAGDGAAVSDADAQAAIAAHPTMFAARQTFVVDAVLCKAGDISQDVMAHLDTVEQVTDFLKQSRLPVNRKVRELDTAAMPPEVVGPLSRLGSGKLFALPQGRAVLIGTVLRQIPNVQPQEVQMANAREFVSRQRVQARLKKALEQLRAKAAISVRNP